MFDYASNLSIGFHDWSNNCTKNVILFVVLNNCQGFFNIIVLVRVDLWTCMKNEQILSRDYFYCGWFIRICQNHVSNCYSLHFHNIFVSFCWMPWNWRSLWKEKEKTQFFQCAVYVTIDLMFMSSLVSRAFYISMWFCKYFIDKCNFNTATIKRLKFYDNLYIRI